MWGPRLVTLLSALLVVSRSAYAVSLSGSTTASLLVTDRHTTTSEAVARMPVYEQLSLLFGSMADNRLSFEGSARGWRDLKGQAADVSDVRVYRAFARWHDPRADLEILAGRQRVVEGVARTYFDGLYLRKGLGGVALSGFLGQPLRNDLDGAERWDKSAYQWGAQADWRTSAKLRLAMSYTEMRYNGDTGVRLVGANATYRLGDEQTLRARLDFDAANTTPDRVVLGWERSSRGGVLYSVDGYYRQARLWAFSALQGVGEGGGLARLTGTMVRPLAGQIRLNTALGLMSAGKGGGTADLGVIWRTLRLGCLVTYSGRMFGSALYANGSYRLSNALLVGARTNLTRYQLDEADAASQTIGSAVFATVTPVPSLDITGEVHQITDDYCTYQLEGLVSLRYRFERVTGR